MRGFSLGHVLSGSALLLGARISGAGVGLLMQVLLAWMLSAHGLGVFYLGTSIATVIGTVAAFGYPGVAVRFIARYRAHGQPQMLLGFVSLAQRDTAWSSGAAAAVVLAVALFGRSGDEETRMAVAAAAFSIPAIALLRVNGSIAAAVGAFNHSFLPDLFYRPMVLLILLFVFPAAAGSLSATSAVTLATLVWIAVAVFQAIKLPRYLPAAERPRIRDRRLARHWRAVGRPLLALTIVSSLFADLTLVLLGVILPKAELAVFGVCLKLAFLVGFAIQLLHEFVAPEVSERFFRAESVTIRATVASVNLLAVTITLAALGATALLGHHILALFGPHFVTGYGALVLLVAAQVVRASVGPSMTLLIAAGLQSLVSTIAAAAVAMLAVTSFTLVPPLGIIGASLAVVITIVFWAVASALCVCWKVGLRTDLIDTVRFLAARNRSIPFLLSRIGL